MLKGQTELGKDVRQSQYPIFSTSIHCAGSEARSIRAQFSTLADGRQGTTRAVCYGDIPATTAAATPSSAFNPMVTTET